jgi:hypothetical protein
MSGEPSDVVMRLLERLSMRWDSKAQCHGMRLAPLLSEILLDQVPMSGTPHQDGEQDVGEEDVARRPVDRVKGGV